MPPDTVAHRCDPCSGLHAGLPQTPTLLVLFVLNLSLCSLSSSSSASFAFSYGIGAISVLLKLYLVSVDALFRCYLCFLPLEVVLDELFLPF